MSQVPVASMAPPQYVTVFRPRPDPLAAILTVLAGLAGVSQLFLSWTSSVPGANLPLADGGLSGWEWFRAAKGTTAVWTKAGIGAYSIIGVTAIGLALVLLGIAMLTPIDHRPLGLFGLVLCGLAIAAAVWWLFTVETTFGHSLSDVFAEAGPGWYLFLVAGLFGVIGTSKAIATG